jgi:hypothetical protein
MRVVVLCVLLGATMTFVAKYVETGDLTHVILGAVFGASYVLLSERRRSSEGGDAS